MTVVLAIVVGFLAARLVVRGGGGALRTPALVRRNYRDHELPTAGGVLAVIAVVLVEGVRVLLGAFGVGPRPDTTTLRTVVVVAVVGFALFGLLDDLLGEGEHGGFGGHLRASWRTRRPTSAIVKLVGGGAFAVVVVGARDTNSGLRLLGDAALVALAANLANLFDRAPGRTLKVCGLACIPLLIAGIVAARGSDARVAAVALAAVAGAFLGLLRDDLHERLMLGDTGANAFGAAIGITVVLTTTPATRVIVLAALAVLTLISERVSFSAVIDRVPPLRAFDHWGAPYRD